MGVPAARLQLQLTALCPVSGRPSGHMQLCLHSAVAVIIAGCGLALAVSKSLLALHPVIRIWYVRELSVICV